MEQRQCSLDWFENSKMSGLTCNGKTPGKAGFPSCYGKQKVIFNLTDRLNSDPR